MSSIITGWVADMLFESLKRERSIRRALHAIARQRVILVLQPGNVPVVERSPPEEEWFDIAVRTCQIRGWVEILYDSIPSRTLAHYKGGEPTFQGDTTHKTVYRLTEGGWSVIHRSHGWVVATFAVAVLGLIAAAASVIVTLVTAQPH